MPRVRVDVVLSRLRIQGSIQAAVVTEKTKTTNAGAPGWPESTPALMSNLPDRPAAEAIGPVVLQL